MYNPQNDVGSIKSGFTRNYSQDEVNALKSYVASHSGSMGSLVDRLSGAGIPLQDIATLTKAVGQMPSTGVSMGGGYGGVATSQGPYTPSTPSQGALAGLMSQMPLRMPPSGYGVAGMDDRIPRMRDPEVDPGDRIPRYIPPSVKGYYPPSQPIGIGPQDRQPLEYGGNGYPPTDVGPSTGGYSGPGGMFPTPYAPTGVGPTAGGMYGAFGMFPKDVFPTQPPYMIDPNRDDPTFPRQYEDFAPPRAPDGGISDEFYPGDQYMPNPTEYAPRGPEPRFSNEYDYPPQMPDNAIPRDPLGELMGQIQNDNVTQQTQAYKNGGVAEISKHPALMKLALSNRR
jgi:hypothetical protein